MPQCVFVAPGTRHANGAPVQHLKLCTLMTQVRLHMDKATGRSKCGTCNLHRTLPPCDLSCAALGFAGAAAHGQGNWAVQGLRACALPGRGAAGHGSRPQWHRASQPQPEGRLRPAKEDLRVSVQRQLEQLFENTVGRTLLQDSSVVLAFLSFSAQLWLHAGRC